MKKLLTIGLVLAALLLAVLGGVALIGWDNIYGVFAEPTADVSSPAHWSDAQLSFDYPGNWKLTTDRSNSSGVTVHSRHAQSPGSAMVIVQTFSPAVDVPLDEYVQGFVGGFDKELAANWAGMIKKRAMVRSEITRTLLGQPRQGVQLKITLGALQQQVPFTIEIVASREANLTVVVVSMLPDDGAKAAQPAVDLIRESVKCGPTGS